MKKQLLVSIIAVSLSLGATATAYGQFGGLKNEIKKQKSKIKKKKGKKKSSKGSSNITLGTPSSSLTSLTKCSGLKLENVTLGYLGDYTFQQGFSKEKRTGFINRTKGTANDCIAPSLQSKQILYFEVDKAKYKATDKGRDYKLQCVKSDDPGAGAVDYWDWNGTSDKYLGTSAMKLHCGNDQGIEDCASGSNSDRAKVYVNDLKKRGKYGVSFLARENTRSDSSGSEKLYCQFYNKRTGNSLVAFEMISTSAYD